MHDTMKHNKLVRDKIPERIHAKGESCVAHIADDEEYWKKLKEKLLEEIEEFTRDESPEEFADVLEVIDAIAIYKKFNVAALEKIKEDKAGRQGRFSSRIILDES